jgi:hypothetical protein
MRDDPLYLVWDIFFSSPQDVPSITEKLVRETDSNRVITIEIESGGMRSKGQYRVAAYFESIQIFTGLNETQNTIRLIFRRRPEAGRFWKDIMAKVVRAAEESGKLKAVKLAYRGNDSLNWSIPNPT